MKLKIGEKIKELRYEKGLTQEDIGGTSFDTVIKICKTLDVEPEEFYIVNSSQPK